MYINKKPKSIAVSSYRLNQTEKKWTDPIITIYKYYNLYKH